YVLLATKLTLLPSSGTVHHKRTRFGMPPNEQQQQQMLPKSHPNCPLFKSDVARKPLEREFAITLAGCHTFE
ncbi:hypothetical protein CEXT_74241, partial [Caerostris extrusa]